MIDLMKNIETDEADCLEIQKQIDEQKEKLDELRKSTEGKTAELEKEVEDIQAEWDQATHDLPKDALDVFKRVAETYDGEAIAYVELQDEKALVYTCDGCFMSLPTEIVNQLMTKDEVIRCTSCTRILALRNSGAE